MLADEFGSSNTMVTARTMHVPLLKFMMMMCRFGEFLFFFPGIMTCYATFAVVRALLV